MTLRTRNDPFSSPPDAPDKAQDPDASSGGLIVLARILAFLFAAVLSYILYRVVTGAWRQYQQHGARSLYGQRRGSYRRVPSLRLHRPEEEVDGGYRDEDEVMVDAGRTRDVEVDEGYHDGESEVGSMKSGKSGSSSEGEINVWKELPERPLPDKPLPQVPGAS